MFHGPESVCFLRAFFWGGRQCFYVIYMKILDTVEMVSSE